MIRNLIRMGVVTIGTLLWVSLFSPCPANGQESAASAKDSPRSSILTDPSTRPPWTEVFMDDAGEPQTRAQLLQRFHDRYDDRDRAASGPATPGGARPGPATTELGINGTQFTLNGTPTFLSGIIKELRAVLKRLDSRRLVTASAGSDISRDDLREKRLFEQLDKDERKAIEDARELMK